MIARRPNTSPVLTERARERPRRPCVAARLTPQPQTGTYLKVPFARCGDGVSRHVSAVASLDLGPFHCLDCKERLSLRRPQGRRRHFAHRPDSLCTGETALHIYAKELLELRKTLTLPDLTLREEGVVESVFARGIYRFAPVLIERDVDSFRPDALVTYEGVQLAVEFHVRHAVNAAKLAKVLARDLSMVEIDLSEVNAGQLDDEALEEAILHTAPRHWVHHRRAAAGRRRLADAVAAKKKERGARLRGYILRRRRASYPDGWKNDALAAVRRTGMEALIGLDADCGHWFTVPDAVWQAQALMAHVIAPSELYTPGNTIKATGDFPRERDLASKLPGWMIRTDLGAYPERRLEEAGFCKESYGSPHAAVWSYLAELASRNEAVFWNSRDQCFCLDPALHGLLYRRVELHRVVTGLLETAAISDPENVYLRWAAKYRVNGRSPARLVEKGGEGYRDLIRRLAALRWMVPSYSRKVVDDLCGLPLEAVRQRTLEAAAKDEADRIAAAEKAALDRKEAIRREAYRVLEEEADGWLAQQVPETSVSFLDYACEGDAALAELERRLGRDGHARGQRIAAENHRARLCSLLGDAARRAFPTAQLADLFLNSGHPRLNGRRPIEDCTSEQALAFILTLLPKKR